MKRKKETENMRYETRIRRGNGSWITGHAFLLVVLPVLVITFFARGAFAQDPLSALKDETLSYFKPLKGKILSSRDDLITSDLGDKSGLKAGMRVTLLREGTPFIHPVTKVPIGIVETVVGTAQVKEVGPEGSTLRVIKGGAKEGDIFRISEMKVKMLFFQDRSVDWGVAEHYYRLLKQSGRADLIETSLDSGDDALVLSEAMKTGAEVALVLRARESGNDVVVRQRLLWVDGSSMIAESEVRISKSLMKELQFGDMMFAPLSATGDALLFFDLPFSGRLVALGDVNGDGQQELIITTGRDIRVYAQSSTLKNLYEIRGNVSDDYLWIETLDVNGDGKDEIVVTSLLGRDVDATSDSSVPSVRDEGKVVSYVYELRGSEFSQLWKGNIFLRRLDSGLIAQDYKKGEGFSGPVYRTAFEKGGFAKGDPLKLPAGINIYDFSVMDGQDGMSYVLAYDDSGRLNLFNSDGLKVWSGREDYGGFLTAFKRTAPSLMVDRGAWTVKDRLLSRSRETLIGKRIPLAGMVKSLGYKRSQILTIFWTGLSMEEKVLVDDIDGALQDYAVSGDRLIVLSKPLFGLKPKNVLKGENPLGSFLYIYSLKGK